MHKRYIIEFRLTNPVLKATWHPIQTDAEMSTFSFGAGNGPFLIFNSAKEAIAIHTNYFPCDVFLANGIETRVTTITDLSEYMTLHLWSTRRIGTIEDLPGSIAG